MKAILFDFDYTLGDSTKGIISSVNFALNKLGYQKKDEEIIRKTIGHCMGRRIGLKMADRSRFAVRGRLSYYDAYFDEYLVSAD